MFLISLALKNLNSWAGVALKRAEESVKETYSPFDFPIDLPGNMTGHLNAVGSTAACWGIDFLFWDPIQIGGVSDLILLPPWQCLTL